jgi:acetylglutamate kinase
MRYVHEIGRIPIIIYDGHPEIIEKVEELGRGKLVHKILRKENEEFEDQFDNEILVKAMNVSTVTFLASSIFHPKN